MVYLKEIVYMNPNTMYNEYMPITLKKNHVIKEVWDSTPGVLLGTGEAEVEGFQ